MPQYYLMLLHYLFPFIKNNKTVNTYILSFQNIYGLYICFNAISSIYDWSTTASSQLLQINALSLKYFVLIDFLLCSNEMYLHHIATFTIIQITIMYPICYSVELLTLYNVILCSAEISTVFLIFRSLFDTFNIKNKVTMINDILFLISFTYTRIYLYSKYLIFNETGYLLLQEHYLPIYANSIIISTYILYFLNLYWFSIIVKKIMKTLPNLSTLYCEKLLKYTYIFSLLGSLYLYSPYQNIMFLIDIFGQFILSSSSYNYHKLLK